MFSDIYRDDFKLLVLAKGLFCFSRMLPAAFLVILLTEKGITIECIAFAKALQVGATVLLLTPAGIICDIKGQRFGMVLSCLFATLYFSLLLFPTNYRVMLGEICNGITIAFFSCAMDAWIMQKAENKKILAVHEKLSKAREFAFFSMIIAGFLGPFFYKYSIFIGIVLFFLIAMLLSVITCRNNDYSAFAGIRSCFLQYRADTWKVILKDPHILYISTSLIILGGMMQVVYQFWPLYFKAHFSPINETSFGFIFSGFMVSQMFFTRLVRKYFMKGAENIRMLVPFLLFFSALCIAYVSIYKAVFLLNVIIFCLFLGSISAGFTVLGALCSEYFKEGKESSFLSFISINENLLGMGVLGVYPILSYKNCGWLMLSVLIIIFSVVGYAVTTKREKYGRTRNSI